MARRPNEMIDKARMVATTWFILNRNGIITLLVK